jgi:uncharacterized protein YyaL (SSP411 family)
MNRLAQSTSPYLLQHAHNPVDWYPWGTEALEKAKNENKLILVSIGYSACHWCHVMEHESFEDISVAAVMNEFFVCIKVDREERPDVDQIYMSAVQLMTGRGGWPLNCICLPDQRPIYGGTYFRKNDWVSLLFNLSDFYKTKPAEAEEYAVKLTDGIRQYESVQLISAAHAFNRLDIEEIVKNWKRYFDRAEGGMGSAPKFPVPENWQFLMRYAHLFKSDEIAAIVKLTLKKMAYGGIYDHIGGGFARYSVDNRWHVPHFEKMLYDNAQLLALYAEAYTWNPDPLYKDVAQGIISFIKRELTSPENGFYAALDADSEGVEGKFYTFTKAELISILGDDADLFCIYFNVTKEGNWHEEKTNVFFRKDSDDVLAKQLGITVERLLEKVELTRALVLEERAKRIRPGLDHNVIASWNGLMLKGLCQAYRTFNDPAFLAVALGNADFILAHLIDSDGRVTRIYGTEGEPIAFLDDYANIADAFIHLYEITFNEQWLLMAKKLTEQAITHFYDAQTGMFYYTADDDEQLIARKVEIMDSVTPASNSVMAHNLKKLGLFFDNDTYHALSAQMLTNVFPQIAKYGSSYANWCKLLLDEVFGVYEIAITGKDAEQRRKEMELHYIPNKIMLGGAQGTLPLLADKFDALTRIYICKDRTCGLPVDNVGDALKQIEH